MRVNTDSVDPRDDRTHDFGKARKTARLRSLTDACRTKSDRAHDCPRAISEVESKCRLQSPRMPGRSRSDAIVCCGGSHRVRRDEVLGRSVPGVQRPLAGRAAPPPSPRISSRSKTTCSRDMGALRGQSYGGNAFHSHWRRFRFILAIVLTQQGVARNDKRRPP